MPLIADLLTINPIFEALRPAIALVGAIRKSLLLPLDALVALDSVGNPLLAFCTLHPLLALDTLLPLGTLGAFGTAIILPALLHGREALRALLTIDARRSTTLGALNLALRARLTFRTLDTRLTFGALHALLLTLRALDALLSALPLLGRLAASITALASLSRRGSGDRQRGNARGEKHPGHHINSFRAV